MSLMSACEQGFALCEVCGRLGKVAESGRCLRCGARLHWRKPQVTLLTISPYHTAPAPAQQTPSPKSAKSACLR